MPYGSWLFAGLVALTSFSLDQVSDPIPAALWEEPASAFHWFEEEPPEAETATTPDPMPSAVAKWTRLYIQTGRGRGRIVLSIRRLRPRRRGDTTWTVVDNERKVVTVNLNDRRRVTHRRPADVAFEDFRALSRQEKTDAEETSREMVIAAGVKKSKWMTRLSWVVAPISGLWAYSAMGTTGLLGVAVWRGAVYFEVLPWLRTRP